jgi:hypothetical protein
MKRQWLVGVWALLGAPGAIVLVSYLEIALYRSFPGSFAFLAVAGLLPGICIGLGLLALLSLVKSAWPRVIAASVYGVVMYVLAETVGNPVLASHAVLISMPQ